MTQTFVIAEAGANHNQNPEQAFRLIDVAAEAGADACKFQTYSANKLFSTKSKKVNGYDVLTMFKSLELPRNWHQPLKEYCDFKNIEFMSTPFDEAAVDELYKVGVKRFKVAGFESTDLRFIKYVASTQLPIIISAGIGTTVDWIGEILSTCYQVGCTDVTILHCNNGYPTSVDETNLLTIPDILFSHDITVGYSDHTEDTLTPALAVMLGAKVIEKHFTLSKKLPGPDHGFALEPAQLKEMIQNIRHAEKTLSFKKGLTISEEASFQGQRSLVTKRKLLKGEIITELNTTTKRPYYSGNVNAKEYFHITEGKFRVKQDIEEDDFIRWDQIESL